MPKEARPRCSVGHMMIKLPTGKWKHKYPNDIIDHTILEDDEYGDTWLVTTTHSSKSS